MNNLWILAQAATNEAPPIISSTPVTEETETVPTTADSNGAPVQPQRPAGPLGKYGHLIILGLMLVMIYLLMFRGPQRKQQQHRKMVQSLERNDRIRTIGGIIGTVVDVKDDEITLKVDESNNTKIKIIPSAIGKNLSKE
jgi:preprotein translocase subunit YajC